MASQIKEEWLKKKYAPIPEDGVTAHKHKSQNHPPKKSSHKHEYLFYIDDSPPFGEERPLRGSFQNNKAHWLFSDFYFYQKCSICGKVKFPFQIIDVNSGSFLDAYELTEGSKDIVLRELNKHK